MHQLAYSHLEPCPTHTGLQFRIHSSIYIAMNTVSTRFPSSWLSTIGVCRQDLEIEIDRFAIARDQIAEVSKTLSLNHRPRFELTVTVTPLLALQTLSQSIEVDCYELQPLPFVATETYAACLSCYSRPVHVLCRNIPTWIDHEGNRRSKSTLPLTL